ncbi:unnamed protein product [Dovyalis caffra]|uniref:Uncharacterized protein n=1 Tax=Dovyalis caffra TaxID=77055 RepID=A0AAV1SGT0_9ROSI|nr:unnamed protein product [Dovyalis caffra]
MDSNINIIVLLKILDVFMPVKLSRGEALRCDLAVDFEPAWGIHEIRILRIWGNGEMQECPSLELRTCRLAVKVKTGGEEEECMGGLCQGVGLVGSWSGSGESGGCGVARDRG